jgi:hypothetical protein
MKLTIVNWVERCLSKAFIGAVNKEIIGVHSSWSYGDCGDDDSIQFSSILYFNVLTRQLQEPITESAQEDKINTKKR